MSAVAALHLVDAGIGTSLCAWIFRDMSPWHVSQCSRSMLSRNCSIKQTTSSQVAYSIETIFPMIISWKIPGCSIPYDFMSSWERSFLMAGMDLEGKFNDFTTLAARNSLGKDLCFKCVPEKVYALVFLQKKRGVLSQYINPNVLKICPWNPTGVSMSVHTCIHTTFCNPLSIVSRGKQHETETDFFATATLWTGQKLSCIKSVSFYNHLWLRVSAGAQSLCEGVSHHGL